MYYVRTSDGDILHDIRLGITLQDATVTRELNTVNSFAFSIYQNHANYSNITPMSEQKLIYVYEDDDLLFLGRVLKAEGNKPKQVTCEGVLSFFNDVLLRFSTASSENKITYSVKEFLSLIIDKVNEHKSISGLKITFAVGNIDVSGNVEIETSDYKYAWEFVNEYLINKLSGYLFPRIDGDTVYINYISEITEICRQAVRVGENIISRKITDDGEEVASALVAHSTFKSGDDEKRIDLTSLSAGIFTVTGELDENADFVHPDGADFIYSASAVKKHGFIAKEYTPNIEITANNLLKKTITELETRLNFDRSYEFAIVDLSKINPSLPKFREGLLINVYDENVTLEILCTKISKSLNNPSTDSISLGTKIKYFTKG